MDFCTRTAITAFCLGGFTVLIVFVITARTLEYYFNATELLLGIYLQSA